MVDDGRTEHGYTISSPCEPDGSGELKSWKGILLLACLFVCVGVGGWVRLLTFER